MANLKIDEQQQKRQKFMLTAETILRYLIGNDDKIDTLVMCKPNDIELITTDHNIYEAMGSVTEHDNVKLNKLTKLLEVVDIVSYKEINRADKPILKEDRVEVLRKAALGAQVTSTGSNKDDKTTQ